MNRKILISFILIVVSFMIVFDGINQHAISYQFGAMAGVANDPAGGHATCNSTYCHSGAPLDSLAGLITTNIPASGYIPGDTFNIRATINGPGHIRFGFEITAQDTSGNYLGTILDTSNDTQLTASNTHYITHTIGGTGGTNSRTWAFNWKAPSAGSGSVTFYGCFNIANNNGNNTGDTIVCSTKTVIENLSTGIPSFISNKNSAAIYPNPCQNNATILFPFAATIQSTKVYDISGKEISIPYLINNYGIKGTNLVLNTSNLPNGIYFCKVKDMDKIIFTGKILVSK